MDSHRVALRALLRRIDEVRGLSAPAESPVAVAPDDPEALVRTLGELVEELERSHRRLIETNVQLVSLREVANSLATTQDVGEATRTVARYLQRAFGFDQVGLLLLDRERGVLSGAWTRGRGRGDDTAAIELPVVGERGALARAFWLNRTILHHDARRHMPAQVAETHALFEAFGELGSLVCVPLQRSRAVLPDETRDACGTRCALGHASHFVPPPGADDAWSAERDDRQERCLRCDVMPLLGVIGAARESGSPPLAAGDVTLVESIALSVSPMVENARLFQELRRSERFRANVVDSIASALVAVNMQGEVLKLNHAGEELLGWQEAEVLGQPVGALFGEEADEVVRATIDRGREVVRRETLLRAKSGAAVPVRLTTSLLRDDQRHVYGAIATFLDLTPLRRAEEHARQMDRLAALGRFTSSVAHEIRNPLAGIGAGVQYLARALAHDAPQRENLEFIQSEIKRLDRIVQELFDVTHPRRLDLRARPIEDSLRRALLSLDSTLGSRGIRVDVTADANVPAVPHDADQIQQVFINLVKNAAEASDDGGVIGLDVTLTTAQRGQPTGVLVRVRDRGMGIDAETMKTLFEPFVTTKQGGTGLGLYITHDIVKRHGGSLTVQSEPGRGATFTVELPLESQGGQP